MDVTKIFGARLRELRELGYNTNKGSLTQQELADILGITRVSLGYYEKGRNKPDIEILVKAADYFNVSLDYLVGKSDSKSQEYHSFLETTGVTESGAARLAYISNALLISPDLEKILNQEETNMQEKVNDYMINNVDHVFCEKPRRTLNLLLESDFLFYLVDDLISLIDEYAVVYKNSEDSKREISEQIKLDVDYSFILWKTQHTLTEKLISLCENYYLQNKDLVISESGYRDYTYTYFDITSDENGVFKFTVKDKKNE